MRKPHARRQRRRADHGRFPDRARHDLPGGIDLQRFDPFARGHHGLVTRLVATRLGVSADAWYRAVRRGTFIQLHPGVARLPGHPVTRHQTILAAVLALSHVPDPPEIVITSHRTAAFLLGLPRSETEPIDITVSSSHHRRLDGVVIHRPTDLRDLSPTWRDRIPCTNELRTLVDLGAVDPDAVPDALDRFTVDRKLTPATISRVLLRHGRPGRTGVTALRRALAAWPLGDEIPDSELELAMARLLRTAGLPPAVFHARVAGYEVDFLIEGTSVIVECDGWTYHVAHRSQWERDLDRDARIHATGHVVLRRSRRHVVFEPQRTADIIRALIERPAA